MCGVIGYVGHRQAEKPLLQGLARLEYRGYDSAGLCLLNGDGLRLVRSVGKLENLELKVNGSGAGCTTGIGHTRWATHGQVTERNAHPLPAGDHDDVAIVLNGIVENHRELKQMLIAEGESFSSETDAEVVAHLIRRRYRGSLLEAVQAAYVQLEGHFAFIAIHRDQPQLLVGARRQCPLLVGVGERETFLASSVTAFSKSIRRIKLLEDDEIVAISPERVEITTPQGEQRHREAIEVAYDHESADRRGCESFMLKEIHEQPEAVAATIARTLEDGTLRRLDLTGVRRVVLLACGSAYHAGLVGRYAIEEWANVPCEPEIASEWRYREPRLQDGTLVIGISQSGETADTLAGLRLARERGARTLAITNSPGSQITREVDAVLLTHAGLEMGVAATKTFTTQVVLLYLFALALAEQRASLGAPERDALMTELRALPHKLTRCLQAPGPVDAVAEHHHDKPFFLYLGRHVGLPVCLEGALKLKEISYIPTEAHAAGEMKHGPIALLDERTPVVCVATRSHVSAKLMSNLQEVRARGAQVIAVATTGDDAIADVSDEVFYVPDTAPLLQPVLAVIPLQLLAYRIARLRGHDVDQPRNLAKTVTVE